MRSYQKKCAYCKLPFIARRRDKIYHSERCKRLAYEQRLLDTVESVKEINQSIDKHKLKE